MASLKGTQVAGIIFSELTGRIFVQCDQKKGLHIPLLVVSSCVGSPPPFFFFFLGSPTFAGAVMLRMWRCGLAVFVAVVWRACCWWVAHVHACGGSLFCCPSGSFLVLPFLLSLLSSSALLSLSLSLCLSQPQPVESKPT